MPDVPPAPFDYAQGRPSYPSLREQAIGLTATLWRFVRSGFSIADKIERRRRRLICEGVRQAHPSDVKNSTRPRYAVVRADAGLI